MTHGTRPSHHSVTNTPTIDGTFYSYNFIGNGAQFRVYAIHNHLGMPTSRVIKVPLDFDETLIVISEPLRKIISYSSEDEFQALAYKRVKDIFKYKHTLLALLQGAHGKDQHFMQLHGNLKVLQAPIPAPLESNIQSYLLPIFYTQDQVTTVSAFWENFTLAHIPYASTLTPRDIKVIETLIASMIQLNYALWEYGFFEFVFKPENMGVRLSSKKIDVIWMDAAEYVTNIQQAEAILHEKHWLHPLMTNKVDYTYLPSVLHEYYAEACDKAFTPEMLHRHWRRKSDQLERKARWRLRAHALMTRDPKKLVRLWVERQTVRSSLYSGLHSEQIDSMQIPVADLEKLLQDRPQLRGADTADLDIERRLARSGPGETTPAYEQLLLHYLKEQ